MKRVLALIAGLVLCLTLLPPAGAHADPTVPPAGVTPGTQQFSSVAKPGISGTRKVGRVLTAAAKSKPAASAWTYQWYRNGRPITAATAKQYRLTGDDRGKRITVTATAWLTGYAPTKSRASARTATIKRGTLTTRAPRISGAAEIGAQLTAEVTGWSEGTGFTYQWYRNGKKISRATRATYVPVTADKGKRLSVKVTGRQAGYAAKSRTSKKTAKVKRAAVPEAHRLRVGSFNITVASTKDPLARPWEDRLPEVVKQIKDEKLHVLGVQEASAGTSSTASGQPQFRDLLDALGDPWSLTNDIRYCDSEEDFAPCPNGAGQNDRIVYRTDRLELLRQGSRKLDRKGSYATGDARFVTWAEFRDRNTGKVFFFVNTHLEPKSKGMSAKAIGKIHAEQAAVILKEIRTQNTADRPVVLVGDLAATKFSNPNAAHGALVKAGYVDSLGNQPKQKSAGGVHAEKVVNGVWNSLNEFKEKPQKVGGAYKLGSYLDYILVSSSRIRVLEWKTVIGRLDAKGRFADVIPSDHHLVRAIIALP
jgi:endonuclease/exonuclease/phosphatase family metal-dependent hydrolase